MTEITREMSFPLGEYQARVDKVREVMRRRELDLLLVHTLPNICYLTGFQTIGTTSYTCLILPADAAPSIVMWKDEQSNAKLNSWVESLFTYVRGEDPVKASIDALRELGLRPMKVGVESASPYLSQLHYSKLSDLLSPAVLIASSDVVPSCMLIKSHMELDYVRKAAAITARGMKAAVEAAQVGNTDNDIAAAACHALLAGGSEYMSCEPIVCAGRNSGIPHGHYARRKLNRGETVLLEMGACMHRYTAPLMRAVALGEPATIVTKMANACKGALEEVIAAMKPSVSFAEVASRGKAAIATAGPSMIFHGTYAYSVGLGFPPTWADCPVEIRDRDPTVLQPGMVFHLPMSLRDEGQYGVAFSETVVITDSGCEVLTNMERRLFVK